MLFQGVGRCPRDQDKRVRWGLGTASGVYFRMLCFGKNRREKPIPKSSYREASPD